MYSLEEQVMCCAWALTYENSGESQRKFEEKYGRSPPSLRSAIQEEFNEIPLKMYRDTMRDFEKRVRLCHEFGGNVFE